MKPINYRNSLIAGYLLIGVVFFIIGFSKGITFFLLGASFIFLGIKENNRIA